MTSAFLTIIILIALLCLAVRLGLSQRDGKRHWKRRHDELLSSLDRIAAAMDASPDGPSSPG